MPVSPGVTPGVVPGGVGVLVLSPVVAFLPAGVIGFEESAITGCLSGWDGNGV